MNTIATGTQVDTRRGGDGIVHSILLFLSVLVIGVAGFKFHSSIHLWFGGAFMLISAAALTVSAIDSLRGSRSYHTRLVVTAAILSLTVGFVLLGAR